jgi:hypothetical protein
MIDEQIHKCIVWHLLSLLDQLLSLVFQVIVLIVFEFFIIGVLYNRRALNILV